MAQQQRIQQRIEPNTAHLHARPAVTHKPPTPPAPPSTSMLKWMLGFVGLGMTLATVAALFLLIVTPVIFRGMEPDQQESMMNRLPFLRPMLASYLPTRAYQADVLPTAIGNASEALALLTTSVASPTPDTDTFAVGSDGEGTPVGTPTATRLSDMKVSTPTPTFMLVTNTPVVAFAVTPGSAATATSLPPTATSTVPPAPLYPTLAPTDIPLPVAAYVTGITFEQQKWNNCGPANMTQVLRKFGWTGTQTDAQKFLKPEKDDKNVSPWQMVNYVNTLTSELGMKAIMRYGGDLKLLKKLLVRDFGVIVEKGHYIVDAGWMGHYLTLVGYDDMERAFYGMDTNLGAGPDGRGRRESYEEMDAMWQQFNRVFIVVYPQERETELAQLLGPMSDDNYAVHAALNRAVEEASAQANNQYAWFNIATNYVMLGEYKKALVAYAQASRVGDRLPWRMLWYQFTPYEAYYNMGDYNEVIALAKVTLQTTDYGIEESYYWLGMAHAARGELGEATIAFKRTLTENPNFTPASDALTQVQTGSFRAPTIQ